MEELMNTPYTIVDLDVRPHLKKKLEPFEIIMSTVKQLKQQEWLHLHATFKPTPLLGVMRMKGYVNKVEQLEPDHWVVTFAPKKWSDTLNSAELEQALPNSPQTEEETAESPLAQSLELDNRGLEPPQPMIRTLGQLDKARPGDQVIIHNDRVPVFLIEELDQLGYAYEIIEQTDGTAKVKITKQ
jgi:uncharacterized protein (DUF2249 family)